MASLQKLFLWVVFSACSLGHGRRMKLSHVARSTHADTYVDREFVPQVLFPLTIGCTVGFLQHVSSAIKSQELDQQRSSMVEYTQQKIIEMASQVIDFADAQEPKGRWSEAELHKLHRRKKVLDGINDCIGNPEAELRSKQVVHYLVPHVWKFLDLSIVRTWASFQLSSIESEAPTDLGHASELCRLRYMQEQVAEQVSNGNATDEPEDQDIFLSEDFQEGVAAVCAWMLAEREAWLPGVNGHSGTLDITAFGSALASASITLGRVGHRVLKNVIKTSWFHGSKEILLKSAASAGLRSLGAGVSSMGLKGAATVGAMGLGFAFLGGMSGEGCKHVAGKVFPKIADLSESERKVASRAREEDAKCSGFVHCSPIGGYCDCGVGGIVRFGANSDPILGNHWLQRLVTDDEAGSVHCVNENFDAIGAYYLFSKKRGFGCECLRRELANTESADSSEKGWEWCATANRKSLRPSWCICKARNAHTPAQIRFGRNGRWVSKPAPPDGYFECNAEFFADVDSALVDAVGGWRNYCMCNGVRELGEDLWFD